MKNSNRFNVLAPREIDIFLCRKRNIPTLLIKSRTMINLLECHHFKFKLKPQRMQFIRGWFTLQSYFSVLKHGVIERVSINPHWQHQKGFFKDSSTKTKAVVWGMPPTFFSRILLWDKDPPLLSAGRSSPTFSPRNQTAGSSRPSSLEESPTVVSTWALLLRYLRGVSLPTEENLTFTKCQEGKSPQSLHYLGSLEEFSELSI